MADKHMLPNLLHGEERKEWGDGGYQGQTEATLCAALTTSSCFFGRPRRVSMTQHRAFSPYTTYL